ncbi:LemA family protein [Roseburia inulinivorans]|jgi:LemA protein|uniref:LemA family protein n=1 Tax=Roseburia inulinivorans TaxID=360807 RepID=A0A3R5ZCQ6_9FIRM|nr:LemA family protein [Roseburia inulinivorans]RGR65392.1 LemA family protein [Roseburia inulinivorans]RHA87580.1 LemA family protein [Roseburia inulinivorans]
MLGMEILVIIGLILLLLVLWIISVQRKFAVMDGNIQNAMNQIGVQISSRFDALFAVLDLMKGYVADDIQPLMERAAARRSVITARSAPEEVSEQEQVIEETVKSIRLAAERNPLLCADKNYTKCMDAVECYGRMVYTSRLIYNDSVTKLNSALGMFPTNVIAGILGFHKREYLSQKGD